MAVICGVLISLALIRSTESMGGSSNNLKLSLDNGQNATQSALQLLSELEVNLDMTLVISKMVNDTAADLQTQPTLVQQDEPIVCNEDMASINIHPQNTLTWTVDTNCSSISKYQIELVELGPEYELKNIYQKSEKIQRIDGLTCPSRDTKAVITPLDKDGNKVLSTFETVIPYYDSESSITATVTDATVFVQWQMSDLCNQIRSYEITWGDRTIRLDDSRSSYTIVDEVLCTGTSITVTALDINGILVGESLTTTLQSSTYKPYLHDLLLTPITNEIMVEWKLNSDYCDDIENYVVLVKNLDDNSQVTELNIDGKSVGTVLKQLQSCTNYEIAFGINLLNDDDNISYNKSSTETLKPKPPSIDELNVDSTTDFITATIAISPDVCNQILKWEMCTDGRCIIEDDVSTAISMPIAPGNATYRVETFLHTRDGKRTGSTTKTIQSKVEEDQISNLSYNLRFNTLIFAWDFPDNPENKLFSHFEFFIDDEFGGIVRREHERKMEIEASGSCSSRKIEVRAIKSDGVLQSSKTVITRTAPYADDCANAGGYLVCSGCLFLNERPRTYFGAAFQYCQSTLEGAMLYEPMEEFEITKIGAFLNKKYDGVANRPRFFIGCYAARPWAIYMFPNMGIVLTDTFKQWAPTYPKQHFYCLNDNTNYEFLTTVNRFGRAGAACILYG